MDNLLGFRLLGLRRTERILPVGVTLAAVGEVARAADAGAAAIPGALRAGAGEVLVLRVRPPAAELSHRSAQDLPRRSQDARRVRLVGLCGQGLCCRCRRDCRPGRPERQQRRAVVPRGGLLQRGESLSGSSLCMRRGRMRSAVRAVERPAAADTDGAGFGSPGARQGIRCSAGRWCQAAHCALHACVMTADMLTWAARPGARERRPVHP